MRTQVGDPLWPAVDVVAVVGAQTDIRRDPQSAAAEAASAQVILIDEGQRPSHFLRCDQQHDRGYEHQTQQTE